MDVYQVIVVVVGAIGMLVGFMKGIDYLVEKLKKGFTKVIEPIYTEIHDLKKATCSNYLVRFLADIEQGEELDEIEKKRFWENYEQYVTLGGNSYIKEKVNKLKAQHKL